MSLVENLWIGSDNLIVRDELRDELTGDFINDATVTFSVLDSTLASIGASYQNVTMDYQTGSNGRYVGILDEEAPLLDGEIYYIEINVTASSDRKDKRRLKRIARYQDA